MNIEISLSFTIYSFLRNRDKFEFDLLQKIPCSKQDNKKYEKLLKDGGVLPEGVFAYGYDTGDTSTTEFYTVYETDLNESEIAEYLTYKKLSMLSTIKNCIVVLTVTSPLFVYDITFLSNFKFVIIQD